MTDIERQPSYLSHPPLAVQQQEVWRKAFQAALADFTAVYKVCRAPITLSSTDTASMVANAMSVLPTQQRWRTLRYISAMAPLLVILGEDITHSTFKAIEDIGRWWHEKGTEVTGIGMGIGTYFRKQVAWQLIFGSSLFQVGKSNFSFPASR